MDRHSRISRVRDRTAQSLAEGAKAADERKLLATEEAARTESGARVVHGGTVFTVFDARQRQSGRSPRTAGVVDDPGAGTSEDEEPNPDSNQGESALEEETNSEARQPE